MITLSADQAAAVRAITHWFRPATRHQQTFFMAGYAGTGKSTTLAYAMGELGLGEDDIAYACFTMKASLVLRRNGLPATTIHRLIYTPVLPTQEAVAKAREELETLREEGPGDMPRALWQLRVQQLQLRLDDTRRVQFVINPKSRARDVKLIVLDEVSMVGAEMAAHLAAFGKPMLIIGDPGQLPPVRGQSPFAAQTPDVMLEEIHRQAAESPIIRLATLARRGERIPYGSYGSTVRKLHKHSLDPAEMLEADVVLCGTHRSRRFLNNALKAAAGFPDPLPTGRGERLIGLKNRHEIGIFNGQFLELTNITDVKQLSFVAEIRTEDGDALEEQDIYRGYFNDHVAFDKDREDRDFFAKFDLVEVDLAWAMHRPQKSRERAGRM